MPRLVGTQQLGYVRGERALFQPLACEGRACGLGPEGDWAPSVHLSEQRLPCQEGHISLVMEWAALVCVRSSYSLTLEIDSWVWETELHKVPKNASSSIAPYSEHHRREALDISSLQVS